MSDTVRIVRIEADTTHPHRSDIGAVGVIPTVVDPSSTRDDTWIDPDATGDDVMWREICDAHDTFMADHEPEGVGA